MSIRKKVINKEKQRISKENMRRQRWNLQECDTPERQNRLAINAAMDKMNNRERNAFLRKYKGKAFTLQQVEDHVDKLRWAMKAALTGNH